MATLVKIPATLLLIIASGKGNIAVLLNTRPFNRNYSHASISDSRKKPYFVIHGSIYVFNI